MKIGCLPICFFDAIKTKKLTLSAWHQMAADLGLDGVEVYEPFLESYEKSHLLRIRKELRGLDLDISMLTTYGNIANTDVNEWQVAVDAIRRSIEVAAIIGTSNVRIAPGKWRIGSTRDMQINYVVRALRELIPFAAKYGVTLAIENHPEVGVKIDDFLDILRRVNQAELKVNLDTSNSLLAGDDPVRLAREVKRHVVHVHASDRLRNGTHCAVGEGIVPFPEIFRTLKQAGYDEWISMEVGGTKGEEDIRRSRDYVRETWEAAPVQ
ncbi:MAG: sugar phosphate isomerase/epimerase family protein [Planctomycetota bacterium]